MAKQRLNNEERKLWTMNDESLYNFWISSKMSIERFIRKYRKEIDQHIRNLI